MGFENYPYSITGKVMKFPWKWYWNNGRYIRYLTYTLILSSPLIFKIHRAVHSPGNLRQWDEIRKRREHTFFDPPH